MAVTLEELRESQRVTTGENATAELRYMIFGASSDLEARIELLTTTPATFDLYGDGAVLLSRQYVGIEPVSDARWQGTAYYARGRVTGQQSFRFDMTSGTEHKTHSIATIGMYTASVEDPAENFKNAIGVGDGQPEGVDIEMPVFKFEVPRYVPNSAITAAYIRALYYLRGSANNDAFSVTLPHGEVLGFNADEVLFLGAVGAPRHCAADWDINFHFAASPNVTDLQVGDITGITKKGWEYLWVHFREKEAASGRAIVVPRWAYVERVRSRGSFSVLGIT
ncbi:MAG: hypothetical protein PVJ57_17785 [Phycisphaerae bacterium]|jgi:hypothetical protein